MPNVTFSREELTELRGMVGYRLEKFWTARLQIVYDKLDAALLATRPSEVTCAECGQAVQVAANGRVPKYCGDACKQKAHRKRRLANRRSQFGPIPRD